MKIVYNELIPFKGFKCINLFGVLFVRKGMKMHSIELNHEAIHTAQMKEMFYVFFYIWYIAEWAVRLFMKGNAYRNISFEKEAYWNEFDSRYAKRRGFWAWTKYL